MTYDFDAMRQELEGAAHITSGTKADRDIARVHALATVALAESVEKLLTGKGTTKNFYFHKSPQPTETEELHTPQYAKPVGEVRVDPVERDWAMGDVVTVLGDEDEWHVENVGIDQGGTFLTVISHNGNDMRVWAEHATFIRHDAAEALDVDFAEAANAGRKSDAFAAAKAKTKKSK